MCQWHMTRSTSSTSGNRASARFSRRFRHALIQAQVPAEEDVTLVRRLLRASSSSLFSRFAFRSRSRFLLRPRVQQRRLARSGGTTAPIVGQTEFESAPLPGQAGGGGASIGGTEDNAAAAPSGSATVASTSSSSSSRTVQETDLYRVSGNFLYYLSSYRGLMVFDISNIDAPRLVGPSRDLRLAHRHGGRQWLRRRHRVGLVRQRRERRALLWIDRPRPRRHRSDEHQGERAGAAGRRRRRQPRRGQRALHRRAELLVQVRLGG